MNRRIMGLAQGLTVFVLLLAVGSFVSGMILTRAPTPTPPAANATLDKVDMSRYDVYRFTDLDGKVTCWLYTTYRGGGISCLTTESVQRVKE